MSAITGKRNHNYPQLSTTRKIIKKQIRRRRKMISVKSRIKMWNLFFSSHHFRIIFENYQSEQRRKEEKKNRKKEI